jgi:hypothetical protein
MALMRYPKCEENCPSFSNMIINISEKILLHCHPFPDEFLKGARWMVMHKAGNFGYHILVMRRVRQVFPCLLNTKKNYFSLGNFICSYVLTWRKYDYYTDTC